MQSWTIGDVRITRVIEVEGPVPATFLLREAVMSALKTYAFHATRSRHVSSIMKEGLDPNFGGTGA